MMRRSMLVTSSLVLILAGCGGDAFTAHADIAAKAAGQELPAQRVADILTQVKSVPINSEAANFVASLWVDYTVFAQAVADGSIPNDSATISDVMWLDRTEMTLTHFMQGVMAERTKVTPEIIDSTYNADGVRVLQHVLVSVPATAPESERVSARRKADRLLAQAQGGANFGALALANSGDPSAQADSGYLPPSPRGAFVAPFDSAAWLLEPGELSGVVVSNYGFHIIRRPPEEEAASRLEQWLVPTIGQSAQQAYFAELDSTNNLEIDKGGIQRAREVFSNLNKRRNGKGKIVDFKDGALTEAMLARFTRSATADPQQGPKLLEDLAAAPDSVLEPALKNVAMQYILVREADRAGASINAEEWDSLRTGYSRSIDSIKTMIGLTDQIIDPNAPEADRRKAAEMRVDSFFDEILTGAKRLRLLPGMLAWDLRGKSNAFVNDAGIRQAVSLAEAVRAADSTAAAGAKPAAGGPPIPGAATSPIEQAPGGPPVPSGN